MSLNTYPDSSVGGGTEKMIETLLAALQARGHSVCAVGTSKKPSAHLGGENHTSRYSVGLKNIYWPRPDESQWLLVRRLWHLIDIYNLAMRAPLGEVLDLAKPDMVIVHNLPGWSIGALSVIRARKIPMIQVLHDYYNICANSQMFKQGKNCVRRCRTCRLMRAPHLILTNSVDAVVGVSKYILNRHVASGAYSRVPIRRFIHNVKSGDGLGLSEAAGLRARAEVVRAPGVVRFGFIGALAPYKGIEYLLEEFDRWQDSRTELWVAGTGRPDYVAKLKYRFEGVRIKFLGHTTQREFFTAVDVTVVPSLWQEALGMVVSESFAFGVPVIGSCRGGIPEMITDGYSGIVFEPDVPGMLKNAMQKLVDNPATRLEMGRKAGIAAREFLDMEKWTDSYLGVINDVMKARPSSKLKL